MEEIQIRTKSGNRQNLRFGVMVHDNGIIFKI